LCAAPIGLALVGAVARPGGGSCL